METILLQINNDKAYQLIQDLEALDIVKVLDKKKLLENYLSGLQGVLIYLKKNITNFRSR